MLWILHKADRQGVCFLAVLALQRKTRDTLHVCGTVRYASFCSRTGHSDIKADSLVCGCIVHEETWYCIFSVVYQPWHCCHQAHTQSVCLMEVLAIWTPSGHTKVTQSPREAAARPGQDENTTTYQLVGLLILMLLSVATSQTDLNTWYRVLRRAHY